MAVIAFVFVLLRFPLRHLVGEKKAAKMLLLLLFLLPLSAFTTLRLAVRHGAREKKESALSIQVSSNQCQRGGRPFPKHSLSKLFPKEDEFFEEGRKGGGKPKRTFFSKTLNVTHLKKRGVNF